jgi:hypothetical protein
MQVVFADVTPLRQGHPGILDIFTNREPTTVAR